MIAVLKLIHKIKQNIHDIYIICMYEGGENGGSFYPCHLKLGKLSEQSQSPLSTPAWIQISHYRLECTRDIKSNELKLA